MGDATRTLFHWLSAAIALPAVAYAGRPFFRSALAALRAGRTNMDVPISIGVTLACVVSLHEAWAGQQHAYFDSAITLLFFLLIGRYLDRRARGRARHAVHALLALASRSATVIGADGSTVSRRVDSLVPGDVLLVAAGERLGADGIVSDGISSLDTSLVSGESLPQPAHPGVKAFAGTINLGGVLRVKVTAAGENTLLSEIVRLVEAAERGRSRFVAIADRVARAYAPVVHATALLTFLGWTLLGGLAWDRALLVATAVLIITCPCALALAVPVVQVVASTRLLRSGVLLLSPTALERLAQVDHVVFDKTGTLTLGRPELVAAPDDPEAQRLAASLALNSRHPLARALARATPEAMPAACVVEHPGEGLECDGVRLGSPIRRTTAARNFGSHGRGTGPYASPSPTGCGRTQPRRLPRCIGGASPWKCCPATGRLLSRTQRRLPASPSGGPASRLRKRPSAWPRWPPRARRSLWWGTG